MTFSVWEDSTMVWDSLISINKNYSFFSRNLELKCQIVSLNVVHVFNLKCIEFIELNSSAKQIECNRPNSKVTRAYQVGLQIWHTYMKST